MGRRVFIFSRVHFEVTRLKSELDTAAPRVWVIDMLLLLCVGQSGRGRPLTQSVLNEMPRRDIDNPCDLFLAADWINGESRQDEESASSICL